MLYRVPHPTHPVGCSPSPGADRPSSCWSVALLWVSQPFGSALADLWEVQGCDSSGFSFGGSARSPNLDRVRSFCWLFLCRQNLSLLLGSLLLACHVWTTTFDAPQARRRRVAPSQGSACPLAHVSGSLSLLRYPGTCARGCVHQFDRDPDPFGPLFVASRHPEGAWR